MMYFDAPQTHPRHGTRAQYKNGCRCDLCRGANADYHRELRWKKREQQQQTREYEPSYSLAQTPAPPRSAGFEDKRYAYEPVESAEVRGEGLAALIIVGLIVG